MTTTVQASFGKGELAPALYGRVDTAAYQVGLKTARNVVVRAYGGISNRSGLTWVAPVKDHSYAPRLVEFQFNTSDTYVLEFGDHYMRVIRNDGHVLEASKTITGITAATPPVVTSAAHGYSAGDEVFIDAVVGMTRVNGRRFYVGAVTTNTFQLLDQATHANIVGAGFPAYVSGGTVARVYTIASPFAIADIMQVNFTQSADVMTLVHPSYAPRELSRTGHASWAFSTPTFAPTIAAPATLTITPDTGTAARTYAVTALADNGEESLPTQGSTTTGAATPGDVMNWTVVAGAVAYSVYIFDNGRYGWLADVTSGNGFTNKNILPDFTIAPPSARNPFPGAGAWPGAVSYYEQRRVFGGSANAPDTSFFSQVAATSNFSVSSPPQDDDAITATLTSRQVNEIRHYVPADDLLIFTSGSEWQANSGSDSNFSAATLKQHPQSEWGASHNPPIKIGKTILYVTENQAGVRSIGYSWQVNGYTGKDVMLLSGHLFKDYKIIDWTFARSPDPVFHIVREDGQATATTFNEEQDMVAWTRWDTQGNFERVTSLRHSATEVDEAVYFVVRRVINGNAVRFIERTHSRRFTDVRDCFFVDAGTSYDSPVAITNVAFALGPVTVTAPAHGFANGDEVDIFDIEWVPIVDADFNVTQPDQLNGRRYIVANKSANTFQLTGTDAQQGLAYVSGGTVRKAVSTLVNLDYLEGQTVSVLADGNVISGLTISGGQLTLPRKFSRVHVGLGYVSDIETLNIEAPGGKTIQGKHKKISEVTVRFEESRGLLIGPSSDKLLPVKWRENERMGDPTDLLTGDKRITLLPEWNTNGRIFMRQKYPLPLTILDVVPETNVAP